MVGKGKEKFRMVVIYLTVEKKTYWRKLLVLKQLLHSPRFSDAVQAGITWTPYIV